MFQEDCAALAKTEVEDTGKPIWEARLDILGCAEAIEFLGGVVPSVKGKLLVTVITNNNFLYYNFFY